MKDHGIGPLTKCDASWVKLKHNNGSHLINYTQKLEYVTPEQKVTNLQKCAVSVGR